MFENLDAIDWAALRHAYGSAGDVPESLRDTVAADPETRRAAWADLGGSIIHQGSRYSATAAAVPFLLEIAADPAVPQRENALWFLMVAATGDIERLVQPFESHPADWPPQAETDESAAYEAVAAGIPLFAELARTVEPGVGADFSIAVPAVRLLSVFPGHAPTCAPALHRAAASDEILPFAAAEALLGLGVLVPPGTAEHDDLLARRLGDPDGDLRLAAAVTAVRLGRTALRDRAEPILREWAVHEGPEEPPWSGEREELAAAALEKL